ncbi:SRPBCC family protein [Streptomyces barkulensis]|uniref:SRPBCC family protein n=1 Tax=Streptomyces barkulensis TaxID=1257026 RepID=UPI000C6E3336|nr:SRPBCC family protein [Streptomyces barkulensis]
MTRELERVGAGFVRTAPVRLVFTARASAPPEAVYAVLADTEGWPRWFKAVTGARPAADGLGRSITLRGGGRFLETVVAAEPAERYAYRVDAANVPGVRAMLEEWLLVPEGTGTRVRYTMAADGTPVFRAALRLAGPALGRSFRGAVRGLDRQADRA